MTMRDRRRLVVFGGFAVLALLAAAIMSGAPRLLGALFVVPVLILAWHGGPRHALAGAVLASVAMLATEREPAGLAVSDALLTASTLVICALLAGAARRAHDRQAYLASHDPLTGALNRRAFEERLDDLGAHAAMTRQVNLLLYLDLDGFKEVNDRHGHDAGDAVLVGFANAVRTALQAGELFARVGGDEFVALVAEKPDLDPYTQAQEWHEQLTAMLDGFGYQGLGCSMGAVIISPPLSATRAALIQWADELMYEVKRAGKGALRIGDATALAMAA